MKSVAFNIFKKFFFSIDDPKNIFLFSVILVLSWSIFSEFLKYKDLVFYNAYDIRVLFSNLIFSIILIIYFRCIVLAGSFFYIFIFLPFVTYFFLRKGILFSDLKDLNEFMFALGSFGSYLIYFIIISFILLAIFVNFYFFKIKIFIFQIFITIFLTFSYLHPQYYEKIFYPTKPNIEDFNISAAFRNIGPVDAFLFHYLNSLSFEENLMKNNDLIQYNDFRSYNLNDVKNHRNIHLILMESFIDPTDFKNIEIINDVIPKKWHEFKNKNFFYGLSPVSGGGSAQAEFEILCGAPSILEYGTEFNRIGDGQTSCLPNYLKKFGYQTIASQPMYGSFFNIEQAYKSIGFEVSYLTPSYDMTEKINGWLTDKSLFKQHFKLIKKYILNEKPTLNYIFAVGCHSALGQKNAYESHIKFPQFKNLEDSLNCNSQSIQHLTEYVTKIQKIDPNSLILILPDHYPPGVKGYEEAGYKCISKNQSSCPRDRKMRIILIGDNIEEYLNIQKIGYYEIPELILSLISQNELCKKVKCTIEDEMVNINGSIVNRIHLNLVEDQSLSIYHKDLYKSLLKETHLNFNDNK